MAVGGTSSLDLAWHYYELGHFERALEALGKSSSEQLETNDFWYLRADSLRRLGRLPEAVEAARVGLGRAPRHIGLLDSLGLSLSEQGDLKNADAAFRAALEVNPAHPVVLGHHAVTLAKRGEHAAADAVVAELHLVEPDSVAALQARAQVAFHAKRKDALAAADELLAHDPENRAGHVLRGSLAARRRRMKPAAQAFAEAAMLDPTNVSVARAARQTRVASHPLLTPTRFILWLGRGKPRILYLAVMLTLLALGQQTIAYGFIVFWLLFLLVLPRVLRSYYNRRYGEL